MKKYNKPTIQIVELSVKESLSALPTKFQNGSFSMSKLKGAAYKNISIYKSNSAVGTNA